MGWDEFSADVTDKTQVPNTVRGMAKAVNKIRLGVFTKLRVLVEVQGCLKCVNQNSRKFGAKCKTGNLLQRLKPHL